MTATTQGNDVAYTAVPQQNGAAAGDQTESTTDNIILQPGKDFQIDLNGAALNGGSTEKIKVHTLERKDDPKDNFMFGMSKIRTFFFFLSIFLLVAFVLVFIFVLPCNEDCNGTCRAATNSILASQVSSVNPVGDVDGDGKTDLGYVRETPVGGSRSKRETDEEPCILDGAEAKCVAELVIGSSITNVVMMSARLPVVPDQPVVCASGESSALTCAFVQSQRLLWLSIDSDSPSANVTTLDGDDRISYVVALTQSKEPAFAFAAVDDAGILKLVGVVPSSEPEPSTVELATIEGASAISLRALPQHDATVFLAGRGGSVWAFLVPSVRAVPKRYSAGGSSDVQTNLGKLADGILKSAMIETGAGSVDDVELELAETGGSLTVAVSTLDRVIIPTADGGTPPRVIRRDNLKSLAATPAFESVLIKQCDSEKCVLELRNSTGGLLKQTLPLTRDATSVSYVPGAALGYFTAWFPSQPAAVETPDATTEEAATLADEGTDENSISRKKRSEDEGCSAVEEITLLAFTPDTFETPLPIFTLESCLDNPTTITTIGVIDGSSYIYSISTADSGYEDVYRIQLPEVTSVELAGKFKEPWAAE